MTAAPGTDWMKDFGIEGRKPPAFFSSPHDIDAAGTAAPQPHALRRAFEQLKLDGILCQESSPSIKTPIIYFRQVERIDPAEVESLQRLFWNQGVAPVLVLIDPQQVHVYSGLTPPPVGDVVETQPGGFVERIDRVSTELQKFILAVETGEYFHHHRRVFDPTQRVDRNLLRDLEATRVLLGEVPAPRLQPHTLDALLCRLVFTCYLFDREIIDREYLEEIGIPYASHLREILGHTPRAAAKADLYKLFAQLGNDFNGDLFSKNLQTEAGQVEADHLDILRNFFHGTDPRSGQQTFWPYEFGIIPIETISAIYEHFLKAAGKQAKKEAGAFYTPRFLAELVLDRALDGLGSLLDKRFLDPACGSGIFLVGLFNRLGEEWHRKNPNAGYDAKLKALTGILTSNLYGIDKKDTACLITAFSLHLALLDQLSPRDIRRVLRKVKVLPRLVASGSGLPATIRCADFFTDEANPPDKVHLVIGNPPWGSTAGPSTPAGRWCAARKIRPPDRQIATAFVLKAPEHLQPGGKVCFVLPYGTLFNHKTPAIDFQRRWVRSHAIDCVLNLADYQRFLFEEAEAPAVVVRYGKEAPGNSGYRIDYWSPKADWGVTQAEVVSVLPQDRSQVTVREILNDLQREDAPQIWKERLWATARDRRLLDRLFLLPRLRDHVRQAKETDTDKPWIVGEGFQPFGANDEPRTERELHLPSRLFIPARSKVMDLILLEDDCHTLPSERVQVRRQIRNMEIFRSPHVLVSEGFQKVAFVDFPVSFHDPIRGIHGPSKDRDLLAFLAAYLRSPLARYFQFHTSSNWGVGWQKVDVTELLRTPFPFPHEHADPKRAAEIVRDVADMVTSATREAARNCAARPEIVHTASSAMIPLIEEYFDVNDIERTLIADTNAVIIPSVRPTRKRMDVPTLVPAAQPDQAKYIRLLCDTLNGWANKEYQVHGKAIADTHVGVGMVVLEKSRRGEPPRYLDGATKDVLAALHRLQRGAAKGRGAIELVRGLTVFDKTLLYLTKPLGQRFWMRSAALNDADEIAGTILMRSAKEEA